MIADDVKGKYVSPGLIDLHGHWFCDANDDGEIDVNDPVTKIARLFFEDAPLPPRRFFRNGGTRAKDQRPALGPSSSPSMSR